MAQGKVCSILDFEVPWYAHHQCAMFDPYPHKVDLCKLSELNPSPSNINKLSM